MVHLPQKLNIHHFCWTHRSGFVSPNEWLLPSQSLGIQSFENTYLSGSLNYFERGLTQPGIMKPNLTFWSQLPILAGEIVVLQWCAFDK